VSDDFFIDEDEAPKPAAKRGTQSKKAKLAAAKAAVSSIPASGPAENQGVSMTITVLVAVIALLLGLIIGLMIPKTGASTATAATSATAAASTDTTSAPQLTQDELDAGALPTGHPDISGMATSETATSAATGN